VHCSRRLLLALLALALIAVPTTPTRLAAQNALAPEYWDHHDLKIPVRDGIKLYAVVVAPKTQPLPLPIMLVRTPYGVAGNLRSGPIGVAYRELAEDGYIFVFQDSRGRYNSEGQFVMNGALHDPKDPNGVDEATDSYDTIDWLVKNVPNNNGKVGVMGVSYPGWLAGIAGVNPHPALKVISPQAPMTDTWMGDDFFHQGAFRMSFGLEYAPSMELTKDGRQRVPQNMLDHYDWYMQFPTLKDLRDKNHVENTPSWIDYVNHPAWDAFWQAKAMDRVLTKPEVAVLNVGGFWDQEDIYGPQQAYRVLKKKDTKNWNSIVLGPWFHGGWSGPGDNIGPITFGHGIGPSFREKIERPWFAYYLHGKGDGKFAEAYVYESNEGGLKNGQWHTFSSWPPKEAAATKLYLREGGKIAFDAPTAAGCDAYVSDPAHPIPYIARPIDGTRWRQWLVEDQRFVDNRPDVLTFESAPLENDFVIAGDVTAHLFASTTGTDADWVVKLIDVYPEDAKADTARGSPPMAGYEMMVSADIMRGRYYKSWSKPQAIPANTVTPFTVDLHQQLYRFLKGHRLMVQVQSTWFPLYDRNPQTFVPNIFNAKASDFKKQTHEVCHQPGAASYIGVGVLR
jgi:putative CocE/NonD family hydrolase